jgi:four helix bundle protein
MKDLSELGIYRLGVDVGEAVWQDVMTWDSFAKWTLGKQLVDAADGIAATMMEGCYRYSSAEQRKFFQYAFASSKETSLDWWRAKHKNLITDESRYNDVQSKLEDLFPQTLNYIHLMQENASKPKH